LVFAGCTTAPVDPTPKQTVIANAVEDTLAVGLVPVLTKNASYIPAAQGVAAALGSFSGAELTSAHIAAFLEKVNIAPDDRLVIAGLVNAAWDTYQRRYAEQVGKSVRPDVKIFLAAVANGIARAIAAVPKTASAQKQLVPLDEAKPSFTVSQIKKRPNGFSCPKCGKEMFDDLTLVLTSNPPQVHVFCECGHSDSRPM
jgi:hypothetical protein